MSVIAFTRVMLPIAGITNVAGGVMTLQIPNWDRFFIKGLVYDIGIYDGNGVLTSYSDANLVPYKHPGLWNIAKNLAVATSFTAFCPVTELPYFNDFNAFCQIGTATVSQATLQAAITAKLAYIRFYYTGAPAVTKIL